jgi:hypothetical protein
MTVYENAFKRSFQSRRQHKIFPRTKNSLTETALSRNKIRSYINRYGTLSLMYTISVIGRHQNTIPNNVMLDSAVHGN